MSYYRPSFYPFIHSYKCDIYIIGDLRKGVKPLFNYQCACVGLFCLALWLYYNTISCYFNIGIIAKYNTISRLTFCTIHITISCLLTKARKYAIVLIENNTILTIRKVNILWKKKRKQLKPIWEQLLVRFPKGTKNKITETGSSLNGFIVSAVNEKLEREK